MTLNWNDIATNEIGYAIYDSLDGSSGYNFIAQVAANSTSYTASNLMAGTMYYWRLYAVTEGRLSTGLDGSRATTAPANYTSAQTGLWNTPATWVGNAVPNSNANVTIANGHTVTIDRDLTVNNIVNNITVATGGILQIGNNSTATRTLNVLGDITVNVGGQFIVNTASNLTHILNLTGDILNNGVFNLASDGNSFCSTTFNRAGNQTISGTGATTRFYLMTLNMGNSSTNVLDITSSVFATQTTGFLTITNGTFKYEALSAITPYTAATATIPLTGGLWINNSSANVSTTGGNLSVTGFLRVTNGVLNVGNAANQRLISGGGDIIIEGGTVNVAGSFDRAGVTTTTQFTQTGGTLRVAVTGVTTAGYAPFMMDVHGSSFDMSGGRIVIVRSGAGNLGYIDTGAVNYLISGGTLQIGDYSTPAGQTIQVTARMPVYNFTDSSANATAQLVASNLEVTNDLLIAAGTLNANNLNIEVGRNWTNQSTFTPGTGTVTFNGTSSSLITKATGESFYNLIIDKQGVAATANSNIIVNNAFTLSQGTFEVGSNQLTLNGAVSSTGGSLTSLASGTVQYNQASAGQTVLAANYGNLTLNAFSKTLPAGTVGVASTLTVLNPATAHVMTGNTIDFNGTGAQTVPATTANFVYNNLTLSNSGTKSAAGSVTVASALTVGSSNTFDGVANNITVNGNIANSGSITGSGVGVVVLTGGIAAHAISGNGAYRNVTLNDANGATVSGKTTINGTLTFTSGIITVTSASDTLSLSSTGDIVRISGHVIGNLQMHIPAGASSKIFPIGTSSLYVPIRLEFANVGTAGSVTVTRKSNQQHPNISDPTATVDSTQDVNAYWKLGNNGVVLTGTYNVTFRFDPASECIGGVSPTSTDFIGERWNGSTWSSTIAGLRTADSTRLDGLNAFGDFILGKSRAALITAVKSGLWSDPTVWGGRVPGQKDTAKIVNPFAITLDINTTIEKLVVNNSSTFKDSLFTLTVTGHLILDGTWTGNGMIRLTTANDTIFGSGSMTGTSILEIAGSNKTIATTANLTLKRISILSGDTLYNSSTLTADSLGGAAANSAFVNRPGSTLIINGPALETGSFDVGTCSNTVIYNGITAQIIKPTTYCHVTMNNSGLKTASASFDTNGDLTVNFGSNLTINSNVTIQVKGVTTTAGTLNNGGHLLISE
jgi:hypothetical protein